MYLNGHDRLGRRGKRRRLLLRRKRRTAWHERIQDERDDEGRAHVYGLPTPRYFEDVAASR